MLQQPEKQQVKIGAGGGTRTHTTFYSPGILSPVRLPFRHTGNLIVQRRVLILGLALPRQVAWCSRRSLKPLQHPAIVASDSYINIVSSRKRRVRRRRDEPVVSSPSREQRG